MREFIAVFLISVLILVPGCLGTQREVVEVYVCPDGSLASKADDCPLVGAGQTVESSVPEPTRYVCPDGEIVDDADDCVIANTILPGTSSTATTVLETTTSTTLEELGTTSTVKKTTTVPTSTVETTTSSTTTLVEENSCVELGCPSETGFVGSVNSDKYHYCDCTYAKKIKSENLICFSDEQEAQEQGYSPCGVCKPPT